MAVVLFCAMSSRIKPILNINDLQDDLHNQLNNIVHSEAPVALLKVMKRDKELVSSLINGNYGLFWLCSHSPSN